MGMGMPYSKLILGPTIHGMPSKDAQAKLEW